MKIILIQVLLPLATYFIGVLIGRKATLDSIDFTIERIYQGAGRDLADQDDIQHVGYTQEQCGYEK